MVTVLGSQLISIAIGVGQFYSLVVQTLIRVITPPFRVRDTFKQIAFVAYESAPIVAICLSSAAAVTIMESSFHMKIVIQNDALVPGFAALLIIRELGAVVTALLITSRVGAGIAAEVGSMQITEQVDALKMLGIDPIRYLVVPRLVGCTVGVFLLSIVSTLICLYVAMVVSQLQMGYSTGSFIVAMRTFVEFRDLIFVGVKGAAFGAVIPLVSCYYGFRCKAGAEGVGLATTNSVVAASVGIIGIDFLLSWIFSYFY